MNELVIEWLKDDMEAVVTAPVGTKICNRLKRYAEEGREEVSHLIENKDGLICCHVPVKWVQVKPPRKMSAESIKAATERLKSIRLQGDKNTFPAF